MSNCFGSFISMKQETRERVLAFLSTIPTIFSGESRLPSTSSPATATSPRISPPASPGNVEWLIKVLALCFTSLGAATQSLQFLQAATNNQYTTMTIPPTYYLFCSTIILALISLILSKYHPSDGSNNLRCILEQFGFFLAVCSFVSAITLIFPFWIKFTTWGIFIITIPTVIISHLLRFDSSPNSSPSDDSPPLRPDMEDNVQIDIYDINVASSSIV